MKTGKDLKAGDSLHMVDLGKDIIYPIIIKEINRGGSDWLMISFINYFPTHSYSVKDNQTKIDMNNDVLYGFIDQKDAIDYLHLYRFIS